MRHKDLSSLLAAELTAGFKSATAAKLGAGPRRSGSPLVLQPGPYGSKSSLVHDIAVARSIPATPTSAGALDADPDLFVLPPPLPAPAVGRRERRKVRRQAQYNARRKAGLCV